MLKERGGVYPPLLLKSKLIRIIFVPILELSLLFLFELSI
jgi:hypothetical protein